MATPKTTHTVALRVEVLESREAPSATPWLTQAFDGTRPGELPPAWSQWSSDASPAFAVSATSALSGSNGLAMSSSRSSLAARCWSSAVFPADLQVSAAVYLNSLIPAQVIARGSGLDTATPSYYALALTRGLNLQLLRVVNGVPTVLGAMKSVGWFSQKWVVGALDVEGNTVRARVYRPDTQQYLNCDGQWQAAPAWALQQSDTTLGAAGLSGLGRPSSYSGTVTFDDFNVTVSLPAESFDQTAPGGLPVDWSQWSNTGSLPWAVSAGQALTPSNGLAVVSKTTALAARAWLAMPPLSDLQVTAAVYLNSLIPAQVFARGTALESAAPSYYAVSLTRGLQVQLLRVSNGISTTLGQVSSTSWTSDLWVQVTLCASGNNLRAQVFRLDQAKYLNSTGQWQDTPAWALDLTDILLPGAGLAGLARPASYTGTITFDNFAVLPPGGDLLPPTVRITTPGQGTVLSGMVSVQASASDNVGVVKMALAVDGIVRSISLASAGHFTLDTQTMSNGTHTLTLLAYDAAGNVGQSSVTVTTQNAGALPPVTIPQHYSWIRIAELAYSGNPMGSIEQTLLQESVDLVIPDVSYLNTIASLAPSTPQLLYTNVSTVYLDLLTDWLSYADAHGISRESAFYHVTSPTPFTGSSPSSRPVNWFWNVSCSSGTGWTDVTALASGRSAGSFSFGSSGQSVVIGYTERFREINIMLILPAGAGWTEVLEYPCQVDARGNPTAWAPLRLITDTTMGLKASGIVLFDPPGDWKPASINGSARLYYVRARATGTGKAPVVAKILGNDYVRANGGVSGVIPVFDYSADLNHDGYLSDAEYARRKSGMNARFAYQGRALYAQYGQMRFATNPSDSNFRNWAIDYNLRLLNSHPLSAGLFVDNSNGTSPVAAGSVLEPVATYASDYGSLLHALALQAAPRWLMVNTAGASAATDAVISQNTSYYEEFLIRPLANNYQQFEEIAALVAHRMTLQSPPPYAVLDSLPAGGSPTDPRTQIATLAYYYLLADPNRTFLDFYGGYDPAGSWSQHWSPAVAYNVGLPTSEWSLFASGTDPSSSTLSFRVYQRSYSNALVLYKPLSYGNNKTGTLADNTATVHQLQGTYRPLLADGTLGKPVTSIVLRNGEGAILVKV